MTYRIATPEELDKEVLDATEFIKAHHYCPDLSVDAALRVREQVGTTASENVQYYLQRRCHL